MQQSATSSLVFVAGITLGLAIIALARFSAWRPEQRVGSTAWRAVDVRAPRLALVVGLAFFALTILSTEERLPMLAAAAATALVVSTRARALVVGLLFVGWIWSGQVGGPDYPAVADVINADAPEGATVGTFGEQEKYVYPLLRPDLKVETWNGTQRYFVDLEGFGAQSPDNYTAIASFTRAIDTMPGTWIRQTVFSPTILKSATSTVYRANATAS